MKTKRFLFYRFAARFEDDVAKTALGTAAMLSGHFGTHVMRGILVLTASIVCFLGLAAYSRFGPALTEPTSTVLGFAMLACAFLFIVALLTTVRPVLLAIAYQRLQLIRKDLEVFEALDELEWVLKEIGLAREDLERADPDIVRDVIDRLRLLESEKRSFRHKRAA